MSRVGCEAVGDVMCMVFGRYVTNWLSSYQGDVMCMFLGRYVR